VRHYSRILGTLCVFLVAGCVGGNQLSSQDQSSAQNEPPAQNRPSAESDSQNSAQRKATSDLVLGDIIQPLPQSNSGPFPSFGFKIGLNQLSQTRAVSSKYYCEGAAGSLIPPLAFTECGSGIATLPIAALRNAIAGPGESQYDRHLTLQGLERFWVRQKRDNLCWAAALESSRAFLRLRHLPQESIPQFVANECKSLPSQPEGADAYQIGYTITKMMNTYDKGMVAPHFCTDTRCIVEAIGRQRPVIILSSSHAVLVQGIDYETDGRTIVLRKYRILDPAGDGQVESKPALTYCRADAFITF
jgi:hypothetical protein